jgi:hypothetical protein
MRFLKNAVFYLAKLILNVKNSNNVGKHSKKNTQHKEKKKLIIQKGGFLQILIPAIISGLASIISSVISKPDSE